MGYIPWYERMAKEVDLNKKQKRVANHLKQQWGISKKSPRKVIAQRTETKSPELTGVDRYIRAKKI